MTYHVAQCQSGMGLPDSELVKELLAYLNKNPVDNVETFFDDGRYSSLKDEVKDVLTYAILFSNLCHEQKKYVDIVSEESKLKADASKLNNMFCSYSDEVHKYDVDSTTEVIVNGFFKYLDNPDSWRELTVKINDELAAVNNRLGSLPEDVSGIVGEIVSDRDNLGSVVMDVEYLISKIDEYEAIYNSCVPVVYRGSLEDYLYVMSRLCKDWEISASFLHDDEVYGDIVDYATVARRSLVDCKNEMDLLKDSLRLYSGYIEHVMMLENSM